MTALAGRMEFGEMMLDRFRHGHLPLYFALSWGWQQAVGESEFLLRLPPALFGLASLWILFLLVERLTDSRTAVLFMVNPGERRHSTCPEA